MQRTKLTLNEEKIIADGYTLEQIYELIHEEYTEHNVKLEKIINKKSRIYVCNDFGDIWVSNLNLNKYDWFNKYIFKWIYLNNDSRLIKEDIVKGLITNPKW